MGQPFFYRDLLKLSRNDERLGGSAALVVAQSGLSSLEELEEAAKKEAIDALPTRFSVAQKKAAELAQIAAEAQGEAIAMRDEVEQGRMELERDLRNLAQEEGVLSRLQADIAATDGAIAERIAQLTEPFFVSQTYTDNTGQQTAVERNLLNTIATLRLRKEFYPAQLAGIKARVEALKKLVK
jgi:chromosome segregation ATPase